MRRTRLLCGADALTCGKCESFVDSGAPLVGGTSSSQGSRAEATSEASGGIMTLTLILDNYSWENSPILFETAGAARWVRLRAALRIRED